MKAISDAYPLFQEEGLKVKNNQPVRATQREFKRPAVLHVKNCDFNRHD
jgi:hypothetical protein